MAKKKSQQVNWGSLYTQPTPTPPPVRTAPAMPGLTPPTPTPMPQVTGTWPTEWHPPMALPKLGTSVPYQGEAVTPAYTPEAVRAQSAKQNALTGEGGVSAVPDYFVGTYYDDLKGVYNDAQIKEIQAIEAGFMNNGDLEGYYDFEMAGFARALSNGTMTQDKYNENVAELNAAVERAKANVIPKVGESYVDQWRGIEPDTYREWTTKRTYGMENLSDARNKFGQPAGTPAPYLGGR